MSAEGMNAKAQILIHKPGLEAFDAFAKPESMSKFWFTRRDDGLQEGESVIWFVGEQADAPQCKVQVKTLKCPSLIVMDWGDTDEFSRVIWTFEARGANMTLLRVEETGFSGNSEAVIHSALDSTGGFNQVIVAAKAWLEHGVAINVVADNAQE